MMVRRIDIPAWQRERASRLHSAFKGVARRVARGATLRKAIRPVIRRFSIPRPMKSRSDHSLRFGRSSVYRLWYVWKRGGRNSASLFCRVQTGQAELC